MNGPVRYRPSPRTLDLVLALVFSISAVVDNWGHPWSALAAVLWVGAVALRSTARWAMVAAGGVGLLAYGLVPDPIDQQPFLGGLALFFAVGYQFTGRLRWLVCALLLPAAYVMQVNTGHHDLANTLISPLVLALGPALAGALLRRSRDQGASLRALAQELAADRDARARAAVAEERGRLARDVHDVVSHTVSLMVVQAGAAERLLPNGSPLLPDVRALRQTGRQALSDLRRQLDLVRSG